MKTELLNIIKEGNVYERKTGGRCLVQLIEPVFLGKNIIDFSIHFLKEPTHLNSITDTELIEDFTNNIVLTQENDFEN
jgi:hypothetical protein